MKTKPVHLTPKEAYILWSVICWFRDRPVTHRLKTKLFGAMTERESTEFDRKMDGWEIPRIVELGMWIKEHHPEWIFSPKGKGKT